MQHDRTTAVDRRSTPSLGLTSGRTDKTLCRCLGAPACRVFPDHLITRLAPLRRVAVHERRPAEALGNRLRRHVVRSVGLRELEPRDARARWHREDQVEVQVVDREAGPEVEAERERAGLARRTHVGNAARPRDALTCSPPFSRPPSCAPLLNIHVGHPTCSPLFNRPSYMLAALQ